MCWDSVNACSSKAFQYQHQTPRIPPDPPPPFWISHYHRTVAWVTWTWMGPDEG